MERQYAEGGSLLLRQPDFFIVGHAKSGTTALYKMLRQHPGLYLSPDKEPWFFAQAHEGTEDPRSSGRPRMTLEQYLSLFSGAQKHQLTGEGSTAYLWSPLAAARIAQANPHAKIIAILREPADFLRALHMTAILGDEPETDFRRAIALDGPRRKGRELPTGTWPGRLIYTDRIRYLEQIRRFALVFPADQILVLIYDDFRDDNLGTVRRVLRFLGVDDERPIKPVWANPSRVVRSTRREELISTLRAHDAVLLRVLRSIGVTITSRSMRKRFFYPLQRRIVYRAPPPADDTLMRELRAFAMPEVLALSEYLERDLVALWGYDGLR